MSGATTPTRRALLGGAAALAGAGVFAPRLAAAGTRVFTPEMFGAKGDGRTNDTRAMTQLATAVNIAGGGTVVFRKTTYIVGAQGTDNSAKGGYRYEPDTLLEFNGCTQPLVIHGNGARIRCADGLRYGVFDLTSGQPATHPMPYFGKGLATPYRYMIKAQGCSGPVTIADLELDGNIGKLKIGGQWGDKGWQVPAVGILLRDNRGAETVTNVYTHHHGQDGYVIMGIDPAPEPVARRIKNVRAEYNGRQGCSIVSGHNYVFDTCTFSHTGRGPVSSAPGAGVDVEAEGGRTNSGFRFVNCKFVDNFGPGFVADTGPSSDVAFSLCTFVGTTSWSAWPNKPGIRFSKCNFTGALARAFGDPDPTRATRFDDCVFDDDPVHSPNGQVYGGSNRDRPLADLSDELNVRFNRCRFTATHGGALPWSTRAIYNDCTMQQTSAQASFPRGTYEGRTVATGRINPTGSHIVGVLLLNGTPYIRPQH